MSKLKHLLRTAVARTVPDLYTIIREAFTGFTPDEGCNCLTAAGYDDDLAVATETGITPVQELECRARAARALVLAAQSESSVKPRYALKQTLTPPPSRTRR